MGLDPIPSNHHQLPADCQIRFNDVTVTSTTTAHNSSNQRKPTTIWFLNSGSPYLKCKSASPTASLFTAAAPWAYSVEEKNIYFPRWTTAVHLLFRRLFGNKVLLSPDVAPQRSGTEK